MICAIVICALVAGGGPKQCDIKAPIRAIYLPAHDAKDCGVMLNSAKLLRKPGEWPNRGDIVFNRKEPK